MTFALQMALGRMQDENVTLRIVVMAVNSLWIAAGHKNSIRRSVPKLFSTYYSTAATILEYSHNIA